MSIIENTLVGDRKLRNLVVASVWLLIVTSCGDGFESQLESLESGRDKWDSIGLQDYEIEYDIDCNCDKGGTGQKTLVCNGAIANGSHSVSSVYDLVDLAIADGDKSLVVSVDPELGFPTVVSFGSDFGMDASVSIRITNIRSVSDAGSCSSY